MLDLDLLLESDGLYRTTFPELGCSFVFRLLTLKEFRVFRSLRDGGYLHPMVVAQKVFERCYFGDPAFLGGDLPAGIEISIGNLILWLSGDNELETLKQDLIRHRNQYQAGSVTEYMRRVICTAFPAYKWEELEGWDREQLIRMFVISESVLQNRVEGYKPLDIKDIKSPEEMAAAAAKPAHGINFAEENARIRKSMGPWANDDAKQSKKLTKEQLARIQQKKAAQRG